MMPAERPYVGGQAVLEGVFMRAPRAVAVAVRAPGGSITVKAEPYRPFFTKYRAFKLPFVRGAFVMLDSLVVGYRALSWSAEQAAVEAPPASGSGDPAPQAATPTEPSTRDRVLLTGTMLLSLVAGMALFVALPHLLTDGISWLTGIPLPVEGMAFHAIDGVVKLIIFLAYIALIRRSPEILRVFAYHGAEHKTIYAWEQSLPLTVDAVRTQSRFHPRCGTSFLLFVVGLSIVVFALVFPLLPTIPVDNRLARNLVQVAIKVPLSLPIAALSYEFIRLTSRLWRIPVCRLLARPGLWLQHLTTEEPDDQQLEVAIAALQAALDADVAQGGTELGLEGPAFQTGAAVQSTAAR